MGLGKRSLPSRAAGTDPHVTFPVVTVSGCPSLMLSVEGLQMSGGKALCPAPPLLWPPWTSAFCGPSSPRPRWEGEIHSPDPLSIRLFLSMKRPGWAGGSDCLDRTDQFLLGWSQGRWAAPPGPSLALWPLCLALSSGPSFRKIPGVFLSLPGWLGEPSLGACRWRSWWVLGDVPV